VTVGLRTADYETIKTTQEGIVLKMIRFGAAALIVGLIVGMASVSAQDQESRLATTAAARKEAQIPLKLQLVLSRYQGDKKISSVPYQLWITTNESPTRLRMGLQIAVPTTTFGAASPGTPVNTVPISSYNMKDIGTNIDCSAAPGMESGVYKLSLTVTDTSYTPQKEGGMSLPSFRNFTSTVNILLRDGQTAQYTSATDPVNGEVLKIDATLSVLK
jgi:hypothetical protein